MLEFILFQGSASFFPTALLRELVGGARRVGHGLGLGLRNWEFGCLLSLAWTFLLLFAETRAFRFGSGMPGSTAPNPEFETLYSGPHARAEERTQSYAGL